MDSRQAGEILAYLSAAWPRYELHEETIRVWVDQLRGVDFETAQGAARRIVAEDDWFPAISRMIALCRPVVVGATMGSCGSCHRGFVEKPSGEVALCPNCRDTIYPRSLEVAATGPQATYDWRKGIEATRRRLKDEDNR